MKNVCVKLYYLAVQTVHLKKLRHIKNRRKVTDKVLKGSVYNTSTVYVKKETHI